MKWIIGICLFICVLYTWLELGGFCKSWKLHKWKYLYIKANIPSHVPMPHPLVMGMHTRLRRLYGESKFRFCPVCEKLQAEKVSYSGCLSITDPPSSYWEDVKCPKLSLDQTMEKILEEIKILEHNSNEVMEKESKNV